MTSESGPRFARSDQAQVAAGRCRARRQGVTRLSVSSRARARRHPLSADNACDRGRSRHPARTFAAMAWRRPRPDARCTTFGPPRIGRPCLQARPAGLDPCARGVVLDLGRARRDRHPGVASGRACAARHGAQDGHRGRERDGRDSRPEATLGRTGREGTRVGSGQRLCLGHRLRISDESATDRGTWSDAARRIPRRRSVDPSVAAATRSANGGIFNVVRGIEPGPARVGASRSTAGGASRG